MVPCCLLHDVGRLCAAVQRQSGPAITHITVVNTGSVAAIKVAQLHAALRTHGEVRVVATAAALNFIHNLDGLGDIHIIKDTDEWSSWQAVGDAVVHIELRRWADVLVIAPLSANTLAKVASGLCDNLLTCVARAWDWDHDPVVVAPAMNTLMWDSPFTRQHLAKLMELGAVVVPPVAKTLACGDVGIGAMAAPQAIADVVSTVMTAVEQQGQQQPGSRSQATPGTHNPQTRRQVKAKASGSWREGIQGVQLPHGALFQPATPRGPSKAPVVVKHVLRGVLTCILGAYMVALHKLLARQALDKKPVRKRP